MGENTSWFGFLEAGDKSTPVVIDSRLNTGDATTVYVYNHKRGEIIEYKRAIAEAKLRELKADEQELLAELRNGFRKARNGFTPRGAKAAQIPEKGRPAKAAAAAAVTDFGGDEEYAGDEGFDDGDIEDEAGEE